MMSNLYFFIFDLVRSLNITLSSVRHCITKFSQICANLAKSSKSAVVLQICEIGKNQLEMRDWRPYNSSRKFARKCSMHAILWESAKSAKGYLPVNRRCFWEVTERHWTSVIDVCKNIAYCNLLPMSGWDGIVGYLTSHDLWVDSTSYIR